MNSYSSYSHRGIGSAFWGFIGGMLVWAVFGNKIKQKINENRVYQDIRSQVMSRISGVKDLTESKYHQIVDEVSEGYAKAKGISQNELRDMVNDIKFHWTRIKDRWKEPRRSDTGTRGRDALSSDSNFDDGYNFRP